MRPADSGASCEPAEDATAVDAVTNGDAQRVADITHKVYAGKTKHDVRFLLDLLRRVMPQCDGDCHENDARCIGCESGDERMCDDCTAYAGSNR